jgi:hypothetical protein
MMGVPEVGEKVLSRSDRPSASETGSRHSIRPGVAGPGAG